MGIGLTIPYSEIRVTLSVKLFHPCIGFVSQKFKQHKAYIYQYCLLFCTDYTIPNYICNLKVSPIHVIH